MDSPLTANSRILNDKSKQMSAQRYHMTSTNRNHREPLNLPRTRDDKLADQANDLARCLVLGSLNQAEPSCVVIAIGAIEWSLSLDEFGWCPTRIQIQIRMRIRIWTRKRLGSRDIGRCVCVAIIQIDQATIGFTGQASRCNE